MFECPRSRIPPRHVLRSSEISWAGARPGVVKLLGRDPAHETEKRLRRDNRSNALQAEDLGVDVEFLADRQLLRRASVVVEDEQGDIVVGRDSGPIAPEG